MIDHKKTIQRITGKAMTNIGPFQNFYGPMNSSISAVHKHELDS